MKWGGEEGRSPGMSAGRRKVGEGATGNADPRRRARMGGTRRSPAGSRGVGSLPLPSAEVCTCWCGSGGADPCDGKTRAGSRSR